MNIFNLYFLFIFLLLFLGFKVATYENSVYGIIYLILIFVLSFLLLIYWHVEFIGLILLIVYVGAIMVFFLFILMLLNLRGISLKVKFLKNIPLIFLNFLILFLFFILYFSLSDIYVQLDLNMYIDLYRNLNFESQLVLFGYIIFIYLFVFLIVLGYILLGAMIAPIVLTLRKLENTKKQKVYIQTLRDKKNTIFFAK